MKWWLRSVHKHPLGWTNGAIALLSLMFLISVWSFASAHATLWDSNTGWPGWSLTLLVQGLRLFELPWVLGIIGESLVNRRYLIAERKEDDD